MNELQTLLADTTEKVLKDLPADFDAAMARVSDAGLTLTLVAADDGGFGGSWQDALIVIRATGYHATPLDVAESLIGAMLKPRADAVDAQLRGALVRTAQIAGAMQAALELSVEYTRQRQQFGRPLASFQAIQQQLAVLAEETAAAGMAAAAAFRAMDNKGDPSFAIAAAKLRANRAVTLGAGIAHQVHGAMGFTAEYRLQHLTRRLWTWQSEFGNERYWADRIGAGVAARGPENFWSDLVAVSDT
jgi:acyl-CoA dehydrogenase